MTRGRSRLPSSKETWGDRKFKISKYGKGSAADAHKYLPVAHTCFFHIELPQYQSLDVMTERISYGMLNCAIIDGDSARNHEVIRNELGDSAGGGSNEPSLFTF